MYVCIENSLFKERVVESSQQCSVGWEDPTEQQEKARVSCLIMNILASKYQCIICFNVSYISVKKTVRVQ